MKIVKIYATEELSGNNVLVSTVSNPVSAVNFSIIMPLKTWKANYNLIKSMACRESYEQWLENARFHKWQVVTETTDTQNWDKKKHLFRKINSNWDNCVANTDYADSRMSMFFRYRKSERGGN